jgi:hypothetical protein
MLHFPHKLEKRRGKADRAARYPDAPDLDNPHHDWASEFR